MERFAMKINENNILNLYKICRLCGTDNPNKHLILEEVIGDGEPELSKKIYDCVGIQVTKFDQMPQFLCNLCYDKINDFYEFREMCLSTNLQTRRLLGLPEISDIPKYDSQVTHESESILGLGTIIKVSTAINRKRNKFNGSSTCTMPSKQMKIPKGESSGREQNKILPPRITLEKQKKPKQEKLVETNASNRQGQIKLEKNKSTNKKVNQPQCNSIKNLNEAEFKKGKKPSKGSNLMTSSLQKLLESDEKCHVFTKFEINEESETISKSLEQKIATGSLLVAKKRKLVVDKKNITSSNSKVAKLSERSTVNKGQRFKYADLKAPKEKCRICENDFPNSKSLQSHLVAAHVPRIVLYYCVYCDETLNQKTDVKNHNLWHKLSKTPFKCGRCDRILGSLVGYTRHIHECSRSEKISTVNPLHCDDCKNDFETQNLYNFHTCITNNYICPKCNRKLSREYDVKTHIDRCSGLPTKSARKAGQSEQSRKGEFEETNSLLENESLLNTNQNKGALKSENLLQQNLQRFDNLLKSTFITLVNMKQESEDSNHTEPDVSISDGTLLSPISIHESDIKTEFTDDLSIVSIKEEPQTDLKPTIKLKIKKELGTLHSSLVGESSFDLTPSKKKKRKRKKLEKESEDSGKNSNLNEQNENTPTDDVNDNLSFEDHHNDAYSSDGSENIETSSNREENDLVIPVICGVSSGSGSVNEILNLSLSHSSLPQQEKSHLNEKNINNCESDNADSNLPMIASISCDVNVNKDIKPDVDGDILKNALTSGDFVSKMKSSTSFNTPVITSVVGGIEIKNITHKSNESIGQCLTTKIKQECEEGFSTNDENLKCTESSHEIENNLIKVKEEKDIENSISNIENESDVGENNRIKNNRLCDVTQIKTEKHSGSIQENSVSPPKPPPTPVIGNIIGECGVGTENICETAIDYSRTAKIKTEDDENNSNNLSLSKEYSCENIKAEQDDAPVNNYSNTKYLQLPAIESVTGGYIKSEPIDGLMESSEREQFTSEIKSEFSNENFDASEHNEILRDNCSEQLTEFDNNEGHSTETEENKFNLVISNVVGGANELRSEIKEEIQEEELLESGNAAVNESEFVSLAPECDPQDIGARSGNEFSTEEVKDVIIQDNLSLTSVAAELAKSISVEEKCQLISDNVLELESFAFKKIKLTRPQPDESTEELTCDEKKLGPKEALNEIYPAESKLLKKIEPMDCITEIFKEYLKKAQNRSENLKIFSKSEVNERCIDSANASISSHILSNQKVHYNFESDFDESSITGENSNEESNFEETNNAPILSSAMVEDRIESEKEGNIHTEEKNLDSCSTSIVNRLAVSTNLQDSLNLSTEKVNIITDNHLMTPEKAVNEENETLTVLTLEKTCESITHEQHKIEDPCESYTTENEQNRSENLKLFSKSEVNERCIFSANASISSHILSNQKVHYNFESDSDESSITGENSNEESNFEETNNAPILSSAMVEDRIESEKEGNIHTEEKNLDSCSTSIVNRLAVSTNLQDSLNLSTEKVNVITDNHLMTPEKAVNEENETLTVLTLEKTCESITHEQHKIEDPCESYTTENEQNRSENLKLFSKSEVNERCIFSANASISSHILSNQKVHYNFESDSDESSITGENSNEESNFEETNNAPILSSAMVEDRIESEKEGNIHTEEKNLDSCSTSIVNRLAVSTNLQDSLNLSTEKVNVITDNHLMTPEKAVNEENETLTVLTLEKTCESITHEQHKIEDPCESYTTENEQNRSENLKLFSKSEVNERCIFSANASISSHILSKQKVHYNFESDSDESSITGENSNEESNFEETNNAPILSSAMVEDRIESEKEGNIHTEEKNLDSCSTSIVSRLAVSTNLQDSLNLSTEKVNIITDNHLMTPEKAVNEENETLTVLTLEKTCESIIHKQDKIEDPCESYTTENEQNRSENLKLFSKSEVNERCIFSASHILSNQKVHYNFESDSDESSITGENSNEESNFEETNNAPILSSAMVEDRIESEQEGNIHREEKNLDSCSTSIVNRLAVSTNLQDSLNLSTEKVHIITDNHLMTPDKAVNEENETLTVLTLEKTCESIIHKQDKIEDPCESYTTENEQNPIFSKSVNLDANTEEGNKMELTTLQENANSSKASEAISSKDITNKEIENLFTYKENKSIKLIECGESEEKEEFRQENENVQHLQSMNLHNLVGSSYVEASSKKLLMKNEQRCCKTSPNNEINIKQIVEREAQISTVNEDFQDSANFAKFTPEVHNSGVLNLYVEQSSSKKESSSKDVPGTSKQNDCSDKNAEFLENNMDHEDENERFRRSNQFVCRALENINEIAENHNNENLEKLQNLRRNLEDESSNSIP